MTDARQQRTVHIALFGTALMWGLNVSAVKALTQGADVMLVASLRTVLAALALTLLVTTEAPSSQRWTARTVVWGLLGAVFMVYANQTWLSAAMKRTSASNAALIMAPAPFVSACLEAAFFRRRLARRQLAGIVLAMIDVAGVVVEGQGSAWTAISSGDLLMLAAVCAFAAGGATIQRLARSASPLSITWFVHAAGAALLVVLTLLVTPDPLHAIAALSAWQWSLTLYSGVLATAFGALAWRLGIAAIGVGRTAMYLSWVALFGVGFGAVLLDEALNGWHAVGLAAVLCGSLMASRQATPASADALTPRGTTPLTPAVASRWHPSP